MTRPLHTLLAFASLGLAGLAGAQPEIAREGAGDRREMLDKMELSPFDQGVWSGLADWRLGGPIDAADTAGKVVLIYTFSGYLPTAVRPITIVNRLAEEYGDRGLVVVGVHADEAYEEGVQTAERRRVSFPIARDAGGALRKALHVDQDPDFYVIDRSGRLRFADIETASVERAVSTLIAESEDDAASLLDRKAAAAAKASEQARRTARLRSQIDLANLPWVPFAPPAEQAYASAAWPKMDTGDDNNNRRRRSPSQPTGPVKFTLPMDAEWAPSPPANTEGRVTMIYLFSEDVLEDFNVNGYSPAEFFAWMDTFQTQHARDLLVVGAMIPKGDDNNRRRRSNDAPDAGKAAAAQKVFQTVTRDMPVNHYRINDFAQTFIGNKITPRNFEGNNQRGNRNEGAYVLPYHILVDSSGTVRWHGAISVSNDRYAEWEAALKKILAVDPGVQARRAAEKAYIERLTD
jgi:peroxiredoxin